MEIVIVTGATSGYGLATAKKFKDNGYTVIIASRSKDKVEKTVKEFGFDDGYCLDVASSAQWTEFKKFVMEKYGKVDVLVNNAGGGVAIDHIIDQTIENIDKAISLNLNSVIYGSYTFSDVMKKQGSGIIVNVSSVCARHAWTGWSVYAAAKAGVLNFTKGLYVDMRPYGVRATCIIPGSASTGFQQDAGIGGVEQSMYPEDVANAIFYVATQPKGVVVEEMTVWATSQAVEPL